MQGSLFVLGAEFKEDLDHKYCQGNGSDMPLLSMSGKILV